MPNNIPKVNNLIAILKYFLTSAGELLRFDRLQKQHHFTILLLLCLLFQYASFAKNNKVSNELIKNGTFETLERSNPKIPAGFTTNINGNILNSKNPLDGKYSLEINTLKSSSPQNIFCRFKAQPGILYKISYKVKYIDGDGYLSVTVRDKLKKGNYEFYHVIGNANAKGAVNKRGKSVNFKAYCFFNAEKPLLVFQSHGPVRVLIDNVSITPMPNNRNMWTGWRQQRMRSDSRWYELTNSLETPFIPWGKPAAYPNITLLSLMPTWEQRWTIELAQRFKINYIPVLFRSSQGIGSDFWVDGADGEPVLHKRSAEINKKLSGKIDCIYISNLRLRALEKYTDKILEKVKNGTGLVINVDPLMVWKKIIRPELGLPKPPKPWIKQDTEKLIAIWRKALNNNTRISTPLRYFDSGSIFMPTTSCYKYGKGRIVLLSSPTVYYKDKNRKDFEAKIAYTMKALLWAAGKEPKSFIDKIAVPHCNYRKDLRLKISRKSLPVQIKVSLSKSLDEETELYWWKEDNFAEKSIFQGKATIPAGTRTAVFNLPKLPCGRQWIDLQLKGGQGIIDWKTIDLIVEDKINLKNIVMLNRNSAFYTAGQPMEGIVNLSAPIQETGYKLTLKLKDADNHLWKTIVKESPFPEKVPFTFAFKKPVVIFHRVSAELSGPDGIISEQFNEFCIVPDKEYYQNTFQFQQWQMPTYNYINQLLAKEMREHGINSAFYAQSSRYLAVNNIRAIPGIAMFRERVKCTGNKWVDPVRDPCLTSSKYRKIVADSVKKGVNGRQKWAPMAYVLDHEVNLKGFQGWMGNWDICFSLSCVKDFQEFLKTEYKDLQELNRKWNTGYKSWTDIKPVVLDNAIRNGQINIWIDHRRHMDKVWTDFMGYKINIARKFNHKAVGLVDNVLAPDSYSGVDFWRLLNDRQIAGSGIPQNYQLAFIVPKNKYFSLLRTSAWHMDQVTEDKELFNARFGKGPWMALLSGFNGFAYWTQIFDAPAGENLKQPVMPDLSSTDFISSINPAVARIREGIDRFVFNSKRDNSGIAILYSRSSEHAATAWKKMHKAPKVNTPFADMLGLLHYNYASISEAQIEDGQLISGGYKLLILPFSQAISASSAKQIEKFAANGGCVLADVCPAIADQHGILKQNQGALDKVFGIKQACNWKSFKYKRLKENLTIRAARKILHISGKSIVPGTKPKLISGKSVIMIKKYPILIQNNFGKGQAVLMNFTVTRSTPKVLYLFDSLLKKFKLKPLFEVNFKQMKITEGTIHADKLNKDNIKLNDSEGYMNAGKDRSAVLPVLAHFTNGNIHIFGLWFNQHRGYGKDSCKIKFPVKGHIYDLKSRKYLGYNDGLVAEIPKEGLITYAVVPYKIEKMELSCSRKTDNGNTVIICRAVTAPENSYQEKHVVKFGLVAPDGREWKDFAVTVTAKNGKAVHEFLLPENAPSGTWSVFALESLSGIKTIQRIDVAPAN